MLDKKETLKRLKQIPKNQLDVVFHSAHEKAFKEIDCLNCANCCKTTGPLFTTADIQRISKLFRLRPNEFIDQYLKIDEDEDYVLKSVPCTFLMEDNKCFIYDHRPQACREYPHTNRRNMQQILDLTVKNIDICPAVEHMINGIIVKKQTL